MALPDLGAYWVSTDTLLTLVESLAALGFVAALLDNGRPLRQALLLWSALGLAFLTKGPPGLLGIAALTIAALTRSEEHTSELQSLMRISYAVFCLQKKN